MRARTAQHLPRRSVAPLEAAVSGCSCASRATLQTRVRAGWGAHEGMAPAMAGRAAQRGYESARRARIEPRDRF
jgi:hypothetical protein